MTFWIGILIGVFIGSSFAIFVMALASASGRFNRDYVGNASETHENDD